MLSSLLSLALLAAPPPAPPKDFPPRPPIILEADRRPSLSPYVACDRQWCVLAPAGRSQRCCARQPVRRIGAAGLKCGAAAARRTVEIIRNRPRLLRCRR